MPYPDQLLPKVVYKEVISADDLLGDSVDYYLIRLSAAPIQDRNDIKLREICSPTKEFAGLSTNLLGVFEMIHLPLKPVDRPRPDYWVKGDGSISPDDINYEVVEDRSPIFIRMNHLHNNDIPATKQVDQNSFPISFKVQIKHKPTKPNYWHFEARMINSTNGQELDREHFPDWIKNAVKKFLEIDICHKASGFVPSSFAIIRDHLFVDGSLQNTASA